MILSKSFVRAFVASCLVLVANTGFAGEAKSVDELLQLMKESKVVESREHKQREATFRKEKSKRASLLTAALNEKAALERKAAELEDLGEKQETQIQALRLQRDEEMGALKELFGHLKSAAGDLRGSLKNSLVSLQYPGRDEFARQLTVKMDSETNLPTINEIEQLIYHIQQETIEAGKIVKFSAKVAGSDGESGAQQVVRVGNYGAISGGNYLFYKAGEDVLNVPNRQPGGLPDPGELEAHTGGGFVQVAVDPTMPLGGQIMQIMVARPDLKVRFEQGGYVGKIIIIGLGGLGILLVLWRAFALMAIGGGVKKQLKSKRASEKNALGRILKVADENADSDVETMELKMEEAVLKERPAIESGLNMIKIISMVAPLMGLLGTVVGMIQTFQAITDFGAGDPKLMAGGISGALVTTVCGLIVAIPTVFMHTILSGKAKAIVQVLDEQSAGIVAEKAESK